VPLFRISYPDFSTSLALSETDHRQLCTWRGAALQKNDFYGVDADGRYLLLAGAGKRCVPANAKTRQGPAPGQEIIMQALILALLQRQPVRRRPSAQ
jgi:hypothetical protein